MDIWDRIVDGVITYGGQLLGAVVTLIVGYILAKISRRVILRLLKRRETPPAITSFVSRMSFIAIIIFAVIASLAKFGVQTTSFVAVLGAASFAIGFALQGSLSNFAAGVLILLLRPFKVGDFIEIAGVTGSVRDIQLFTTVLATPDNVKVLVPNGKILGDTIRNYGGYETRRLDVHIGIGYSVSIEKALSVAYEVLGADDRILTEPAPQVLVTDLADSSVNLVLRAWVNRANYGTVLSDLKRCIKEAFDENSIEIPFPQMVIHTADND
ncbi:mechanosensitive ion channel [Candidatus Bipolaricaulota bacterium]|nr:mechanosensitive ion channel [Candidatus Bipolaricaulota bacterium]